MLLMGLVTVQCCPPAHTICTQYVHSTSLSNLFLSSGSFDMVSSPSHLLRLIRELNAVVFLGFHFDATSGFFYLSVPAQVETADCFFSYFRSIPKVR
jgi:hypothetical protein